MICSKIVNFDRTESGLTAKLGRILPAVQFNGAVRTCLTALYDDVRRCVTSPKKFLQNFFTS